MCDSKVTGHLHDLAEAAEAQADLAIQARIAQLVRETPVLLFMKGTPEQPRCGFSAAAVKMLRRHDVPLASVDVLAEPAIRAGVKRFADWPTIPQLYVSGEFVGGFDIIRAMDEAGELAPLLAGAR